MEIDEEPVAKGYVLRVVRMREIKLSDYDDACFLAHACAKAYPSHWIDVRRRNAEGQVLVIIEPTVLAEPEEPEQGSLL